MPLGPGRRAGRDIQQTLRCEWVSASGRSARAVQPGVSDNWCGAGVRRRWPIPRSAQLERRVLAGARHEAGAEWQFRAKRRTAAPAVGEIERAAGPAAGQRVDQQPAQNRRAPIRRKPPDRAGCRRRTGRMRVAARQARGRGEAVAIAKHRRQSADEVRVPARPRRATCRRDRARCQRIGCHCSARNRKNRSRVRRDQSEEPDRHSPVLIPPR